MKTKTSSKLETTSNTATRGRGRPHLFYPDIVSGVSALIVDMHGKAHTADEIALAITDKFVNKAGDPLKVCAATVRTFGRKTLNLLWHVGKRRSDGTLNAYGADLAMAAAKVPATKGRSASKSAKGSTKAARKSGSKGRSATPAKGGGKARAAARKPASAPRNASQASPKGKRAKVSPKDSAVSA